LYVTREAWGNTYDDDGQGHSWVAGFDRFLSDVFGGVFSTAEREVLLGSLPIRQPPSWWSRPSGDNDDRASPR
jgi:hypothetical protein